MQGAIRTKIDQLARVAVGVDVGDLPALVALSELAGEIAAELARSGLEGPARLAERVKAEIEAVVFRTTDAPEEGLTRAHRAIDELQRGGSGEGAEAATNDAAPGVDQALLSAWVAGCEGMLGELEAQLLTVEKNAADAEAQAEIRRIVHTLKGECGVLALHEVQRLCHEVETAMDRRASAGAAFPVGVFLELVDWLKGFVGSLASDAGAPATGHEALLARIIAAQSGTGEPETSRTTGAGVAVAGAESAGDRLACDAGPGNEENLADFLCEAREHITGAEGALLALEQDASNKELINTVFRAFHTIKGVAGFLHLTPIVALSHRAEQLLAGARSGTMALGRNELDLVLSSCDMLGKLLAMLGGGAAPSRADYETLLSGLDAAASVGVAVGAAVQATPVATEGYESPAEVMKSAVAAAASAPAEEKRNAPSPATSVAKATPRRADQTVKVSTARMDSLVTMVGELVIAHQMAVQGAASLGGEGQEMQRTLAQVQKIVRDVQEVSMALRMVSLRGTFQRMTRLVRDVALKAGKEIACVTEGEEVELDRNVVEEITDPLVHMIRNACDHGLETATERIAAGKSPAGRVTLKAYHSGGSIVLEIGDDGRGLRRDRILAKAKANGLIDAKADEASIPDSDVFALIFLPGFSTAEKVTDISGRGVGMDVVRRNIEALRGKIDIRSMPGKGTTFLVRVPLTMAIIDGMVVRVGTEKYVLPTLSIEHAFRPGASDVSTVAGRGEVVNVRGRLLPIHRLGRLLGVESMTEPKDGLLVVVESAVSKCALLVDEIMGQQQVVIKSLGGSQARGVAGGAILGDGRVALILDVGGLRDSIHGAAHSTH